MSSNPRGTKRQKEAARADKRRAKEARRVQRRADKGPQDSPLQGDMPPDPSAPGTGLEGEAPPVVVQPETRAGD